MEKTRKSNISQLGNAPYAGKATWLLGTASGTPLNMSTETVTSSHSFRLEFGVATSVPTAKARQQLRAWGFNPRVSNPAPFNTFGTREEVLANAGTKVSDNLASVDVVETELA